MTAPLTVGLTGGIASGKSLVAGMFVSLGVQVIDTDAVAREVVAPGRPGLDAIRSTFGEAALTPAGELDRGKMRQLVFADPAARRTLETILHPLIRARTLEMVGSATGPYVLVAVPLLVETDFGKLVDRIVVVDCPTDLQIERLMKRDALTAEAARAMIGAQADRATRLEAAHDVIDNSGSIASTRRQVERLHDHYLALCNRRPTGL
jgi:dephospho-CoA kinase